MTTSPAYAIALTVHAERIRLPRYVGDVARGTGRLVRSGEWLVTWPDGTLSVVDDARWRGWLRAGANA